MISIKVLLANGSELRQLRTENTSSLRIVDVSNTFVSTLPIQYMPELQQLQIQESSIKNLDLKQCALLKRVLFGFEQICSINLVVATYLNQIEVPSSPIISNDNQLCTAKYYGSDLASLGINYEADVYGDVIEFRGNSLTKRLSFN